MLPVRYWKPMHHGAFLSFFLTAALGVRIGYEGFFKHASMTADRAAKMALAFAQPDVELQGIEQGTAVRTALQSNVLAPFEFFLFTPLGWISVYLFVTGTLRGVAYATDHPRGDPILTFIDHAIHHTVDRGASTLSSIDLSFVSALISSDTVEACRKFAGEEADFVVVSAQAKPDWIAGATVIADSVPLRVGCPREVVVDGVTRTCYPLTLMRTGQVDRKIIHYRWPRDAPPLPVTEADAAD